MIVNLGVFILGYFVSGVKLFVQYKRWTGAGVNWAKDFWGLKDIRIQYVLENFFREPKRWAHHSTDYVVEWTRLHPQRAAKTFAGITILCLLLALT